MCICRSCTLRLNSVSFFIGSFLKSLLINYFPRLYVMIAASGYLHKHYFYNGNAFVDSCMLSYCTILDHPVMGFIIVTAYSTKESFWTFFLILYGSIGCTQNLSHGVASTCLAGIWNFLGEVLFLWKVLQTSMWVRMPSLKLVH